MYPSNETLIRKLFSIEDRRPTDRVTNLDSNLTLISTLTLTLTSDLDL